MTLRSLALMGITLLAWPWLESRVSSSGRVDPVALSSGRTASSSRVRLTLRTGQSREATLDGVGCSQTICSRIAIRARSERGHDGESLVRFGDIRTVRLSGAGHATVEGIDGSRKQFVIPVENRVLYLIEPGHASARLDVGELLVIEFLR